MVDLQRKPKDGSASPSVRVAEKCLYSIANVSCKVYTVIKKLSLLKYFSSLAAMEFKIHMYYNVGIVPTKS